MIIATDTPTLPNNNDNKIKYDFVSFVHKNVSTNFLHIQRKKGAAHCDYYYFSFGCIWTRDSISIKRWISFYNWINLICFLSFIQIIPFWLALLNRTIAQKLRLSISIYSSIISLFYFYLAQMLQWKWWNLFY